MIDQLVSLHDAFVQFANASETQSQSHIASLHWHLAVRLVIEGGFRPDDISPRPPLRIEAVGSSNSRRFRLVHDASAATPGEQTILGGLKTKGVDVVIANRWVGPCLAISVKGTLNAFRNLTNRMEEAAGDCTNIHIAYPNLIYGFLHIMRANRESQVQSRNDIAIDQSGTVSDGIVRYHDAMSRLTDRRDVRNDVSRYEAVALALIEPAGPTCGAMFSGYPNTSSPLFLENFLPKLYQLYDLRYVYSAPPLKNITTRAEWTPDSPVLEMARTAGFEPRVASE
jgi:hypothetical protein